MPATPSSEPDPRFASWISRIRSSISSSSSGSFAIRHPPRFRSYTIILCTDVLAVDAFRRYRVSRCLVPSLFGVFALRHLRCSAPSPFGSFALCLRPSPPLPASTSSGCPSPRIAPSSAPLACSSPPSDMYYTAADGRQILDGTAGLWCVNAGHCRESITAAIREQAGVMDYAPPFQMGHPLAFELAQQLADHAARRHRSRLLRQLGLRGRRHGAQDRARLLAGEG